MSTLQPGTDLTSDLASDFTPSRSPDRCAGPAAEGAWIGAAPERPDKPEEACGVFAVLAAEQPVANLTYFGLYALQHRGQESAGIAVFDAVADAAAGSTLLQLPVAQMAERFEQAIPRRMGVDLPPTA